MKKLFTVFCILLNALVFGQQKTISGKVLNGKNEPVAYANIALVNITTSKTVKGTLSDSLGNFIIAVAANGNFKLQVTNTGFEPYHSAPFLLDSAHTAVNMPAITLSEKFETNKAVVVQAKKKFIEIQADKTVLNIENSVVAVGNSAFELIKKAPAVTVDKDDNLKLKGSVASIYVDGKPFYLTGEQLTQYLKNLDADAISKNRDHWQPQQ
ncbi:carboxypeptidase-like regulatory domain-containing protein [Ferruginibacter sp.]